MFNRNPMVLNKNILYNFIKDKSLLNFEKNLFQTPLSGKLITKVEEVRAIVTQFNTNPLKKIELKSYSNNSQNKITITNLKSNFFRNPQSLNLWLDSTQPVEYIRGGLDINSLSTNNNLFFFKNELNLNKFFIERLLYKFSEVDWVYYFFLPKQYQYYIYKYSLFVKWVITDTNLWEFSTNKNQIDSLINTNNLSEVMPIKLNKKL